MQQMVFNGLTLLMAGKSEMKTVKERFEAKFLKSETGCWLWTAGCYPDGYGMFNVSGRARRAHRVAYEFYVGPIPERRLVCHKCDVRPCVRPDHLWLGANIDNMADMIRKGRSAVGDKHYAAKLTTEDVLAIRAESGLPQKQLAARYGVSVGQISGIIRRRTWSHI